MRPVGRVRRRLLRVADGSMRVQYLCAVAHYTTPLASGQTPLHISPFQTKGGASSLNREGKGPTLVAKPEYERARGECTTPLQVAVVGALVIQLPRSRHTVPTRVAGRWASLEGIESPMMELAMVPAHSGHVTSLLFSPDGQALVAAAMVKAVKPWGAASWELLRTLHWQNNSVDTLCMPADGHMIASCSVDRIAHGSARVLPAAQHDH